jgi:hypothetical protein
LGYYDAPKSSGYAIFRAWFDGDDIRKDPICAHLATEGGDQKNLWIGPDVHFIASASKKGKEFNWVMTHKVLSPIPLEPRFLRVGGTLDGVDGRII